MAYLSGERTAHLLIRIGVAFAFLYPPISAFVEPYTWLGYLPEFARFGTDGLLLLHVFGVVEIALALWILWGRYLFYPSILAAVLLVAIVILNPQEFPILFRDLSIAAMALALALWQPRQRLIANE